MSGKCKLCVEDDTKVSHLGHMLQLYIMNGIVRPDGYVPEGHGERLECYGIQFESPLF